MHDGRLLTCSHRVPEKEEAVVDATEWTDNQLPSVNAMANLPSPQSTASFWHSEPSETLLGHRTTAALPAEADVIVVGSGITGASVARYLSEDERAKHLRVVMLEAREACWGATGRVI